LELEARQLDDARHIEIDRRLAELRKFDAEARRQDRECWQGWQIAVSAMTAGAALFAAGAAFKLDLRKQPMSDRKTIYLTYISRSMDRLTTEVGR
jgi:hypothetical protein